MHDQQDNLIWNGKKSPPPGQEAMEGESSPLQSHKKCWIYLAIWLVTHNIIKDEYYPTLWTHKVHSYMGKPLSLLSHDQL